MEIAKCLFQGGEINGVFQGYDNSSLFLTDGLIGFYYGVHEHSQGYMSGGHVKEALQAWNYGTFFLSGGTVGEFMAFRNNSVLTIYGSDFKIGGIPVDYGEYNGINHITGILANGDVLDNDFYFYSDAKLILAIPEPTTIVLVGFGGLAIRKRRKNTSSYISDTWLNSNK